MYLCVDSYIVIYGDYVPTFFESIILLLKHNPPPEKKTKQFGLFAFDTYDNITYQQKPISICKKVVSGNVIR